MSCLAVNSKEKPDIVHIYNDECFSEMYLKDIGTIDGAQTETYILFISISLKQDTEYFFVLSFLDIALNVFCILK